MELELVQLPGARKVRRGSADGVRSRRRGFGIVRCDETVVADAVSDR